MPPKPKRRELKQYTYEDLKRLNNPPVGLVTAETDHLNGQKSYQFDPHLDPQLQWAGKAEGASFTVDTVSLHVHERIDPLTIIKAVKSRAQQEQSSLFGFFENKENNPPIREAIEFYKHSQGWSNRLIAGDSLLVMNSLLEKEGMARKVQMIFVDPPYGIKYGSNFQPFVNKRQVKDGVDEDLTQEPETVKAFRDTWELGIHSYLTYLRDRLLLARVLLNESGSIFVQIGEENIHHVREIMEEIFGAVNFVSLISFRKTSAQTAIDLPSVSDYLLWFARDKGHLRYNQLFVPKELGDDTNYTWVEEVGSHKRKKITIEEVRELDRTKDRLFRLDQVTSQTGTESSRFEYEFEDKKFKPVGGRGWSTSKDGLDNLKKANRLMAPASILSYVRYFDDFPVRPLTNQWPDTGSGGFLGPKIFVVQTSEKAIQRCILMTTNPGDLVLDPTCGSGTTAFVAEQWGRRWISCDTSRVAITIAKQRLMTAVFDYYELSNRKEGVSGGFKYQKVPHVTLRSVANNDSPETETLFDQPILDQSRKRVTGPFTLEAVPSQEVRSMDETADTRKGADPSIARSGETLRQNEWVDELLSTGIRGKSGQVLKFVRVEMLSGTRWLNARADTGDGKTAVISFGPEYSPLEQRQVELAIDEAQELVPRPKLVVFAAFQFDPEAAKDIDELKWSGVDVLKVQMNTDLLTSDLKKKTPSNESFWLVGQPDVEVRRAKTDYQIVVNGFDYYNTRSGELESGDASKIAVWELDTDYDGRSLYPRQVFFPMSGSEGGWARLAKNLRGLIDEDLIESYRGNVSIPFKIGSNRQVAVKIIDDRGIESLKIIRVGE